MLPTETLFTIFNTGVLIPWLLLIFAPKWQGTEWMIKTKLPVIILAATYVTLFVIDLTTSSAGGIDFTSFSSICNAFGRQEVVLAGWIHYLAFDLLVGIAISQDAQKNKMPHYLLVPCLILTLMLGPTGWLLYYLTQKI